MSQKVSFDDLEQGDILLYHGTAIISKLIQFFDGTEVNHASLYLGDGLVGEAVAKGLIRQDVTESVKGNKWVRVLRLKTPPASIQPVLDKANEYLPPPKERYAFEALLLLAPLCLTRGIKPTAVRQYLIKKVLRAASAMLLRLVSGGKEPMICSEFVYRAYNEAEDMAGSLSLGAGFAAADASGAINPQSLLAQLAITEAGPESYPDAGVFGGADLVADDAALGQMLEEIESLGKQHLAEVEEIEEAAGFSEEELAELRPEANLYVLSRLYAEKQPDSPDALGDSIPDATKAAFESLFKEVADFATPGGILHSPDLNVVGDMDY